MTALEAIARAVHALRASRDDADQEAVKVLLHQVAPAVKKGKAGK